MPYIGVSPQFGVRRKHTYTATAGQTSFSGAGSEGATLSYTDSNFVDVYQNGIKLGDADYTSTSGTAIVLAQGASVDDLIEIIVFDAFSAADTVSKADGGTFDGNVTMGGNLSVSGAFTSQGIDDNVDATAITIESDEDITITKQGTGTTDVRFENSSNSFGGNIKYDHNVGNMIFEVHNGERARFRSDGGICFNGDTAAANALDDYEEGSWTPSVGGDTTYDNQIGRYVKIGNKVTLWFYIQINQRNTPSVAYIAGSSPFTNSSSITGSGLVHYFEGINNNAVVLTARIDPGGANINISGSTGSAATVANVNHDWVKNGGDIYGFVTHYTG